MGDSVMAYSSFPLNIESASESEYIRLMRWTAKDKVLSGFNVTVTNNVINITKGEAIVGGILVSQDDTTTINETLTSKVWCLGICIEYNSLTISNLDFKLITYNSSNMYDLNISNTGIDLTNAVFLPLAYGKENTILGENWNLHTGCIPAGWTININTDRTAKSITTLSRGDINMAQLGYGRSGIDYSQYGISYDDSYIRFHSPGIYTIDISIYSSSQLLLPRFHLYAYDYQTTHLTTGDDILDMKINGKTTGAGYYTHIGSTCILVEPSTSPAYAVYLYDSAANTRSMQWDGYRIGKIKDING